MVVAIGGGGSRNRPLRTALLAPVLVIVMSVLPDILQLR